MAEVDTILAQACASGIGKLESPVALLRVIAQLLQDGAAGAGRVYLAIVTQTGTNDPVAQVLIDQIGIYQSDYARASPGVYTITKPLDVLPVGKTIAERLPTAYFPASFAGDETFSPIGVFHGATTVVQFQALENGLGADGVLNGDTSGAATYPAFLKITVYP